jgi:hypothetical protein
MSAGRIGGIAGSLFPAASAAAADAPGRGQKDRTATQPALDGSLITLINADAEGREPLKRFLEVGLEDRFQHKLGGSLHHSSYAVPGLTRAS